MAKRTKAQIFIEHANVEFTRLWSNRPDLFRVTYQDDWGFTVWHKLPMKTTGIGAMIEELFTEAPEVEITWNEEAYERGERVPGYFTTISVPYWRVED